MNTSERGRELIKAHEGLRLEAYQDSVGVWTLGFGHTRGVKRGDTCSDAQAEAWLIEDLTSAEQCINTLVTVPLTQGEFDALASFTFNLGCTALRNSMLLKLLNNSDYDSASLEFGKWTHAGGVVLAGLVARREAERRCFEATA